MMQDLILNRILPRRFTVTNEPGHVYVAVWTLGDESERYMILDAKPRRGKIAAALEACLAECIEMEDADA